jgi:hypothetical protein
MVARSAAEGEQAQSEFTAAKTRLINLRVAEREGKLIEWPIGQRPLHTALNRLMKSLGGAP